MKKHWKPILTLLLLLPFLTEVLVGMPITQILNPPLFLMLITVGYGFPVLVIREISARNKYGLFAMLALGVAYGLFNEGLMARTIFAGYHSPVDTFANYGLIGGMRAPWALVISLWHALHAVIYPIAFIHYLYPSHASEPWLSKRGAWVLGMISFLAGVAVFFSGPPQNPRGFAGHFIFIIVAWFLLWILAKRAGSLFPVVNQDKQDYGLKPVVLGAVIYLLAFLLPLIFSKAGMPAVLLIGYLIAVLIAGYKIYRGKEMPLQKLVLIGLGGGVCVLLFSMLITLPFGLLLQGLTNTALAVIFIRTIFKVKKGAAKVSL